MPIRQERHPWLYAINVERHRFFRTLYFLFSRHYASDRQAEPLPFKVFSHRSLLLRKLGDADMRLQKNKVTNLRIATKAIDGILIKPGETFSLWKLVGRPSGRRGFVNGMLLSDGKVKEGVGGGLCQLANLLYWMALHTPLTITERFRHSYDVFPDSGRVLPFGSGATIFYNYIDLAFRNDTDETWQIRVHVSADHLEGEIRSSHAWPVSYSVLEENHAFYRDGNGKWRRKNELFQVVTDRKTGNTLEKRPVAKNDSLVLYDPPGE